MDELMEQIEIDLNDFENEFGYDVAYDDDTDIGHANILFAKIVKKWKQFKEDKE